MGLSWSPTGLAAYSRCILGVLTSNLTLSFWQTVDGSSKWSRVLVVNHSLRDYFMLNVGVDVEVVVRKHRIRAFSWSHSLDITTDTQNGGESSLQGARDLFAVGNDVGDVVFLKVGSAGGGVLRHDIDGAGGYEYSRVEVLSHHSLDESMIPRCIDPNSLFASSLRDRAVITDISWSRWVRIPSKDDSRHTVQSYQALVAVVKGSELDILRVETAIEMEGEDKEVFKCHGSIIGSQPLKTQLEAFSFKGPLYWIPKVRECGKFLVVCSYLPVLRKYSTMQSLLRWLWEYWAAALYSSSDEEYWKNKVMTFRNQISRFTRKHLTAHPLAGIPH